MIEPKWKRFEKLIHGIHTQFAPEGAVVTLDDESIARNSRGVRRLKRREMIRFDRVAAADALKTAQKPAVEKRKAKKDSK
jgi:hypothetical protein